MRRPAPARRSQATATAQRALGFLGELHPLVARAWDLQRAAAFAIDLGKLAALASPLVEFTTFGPFPPLRLDLAVTLPESVAAERRARAGARGRRRRARARRACSTSTAASRWGRGGARWRSRSRFRTLERTLTDEDVEPVRARIVDGAAKSSAVSCVASSRAAAHPTESAPRLIVAGATGFTGALAAHLLWRHPDFELVAVTGRSELGPPAGRRSTRAIACR